MIRRIRKGLAYKYIRWTGIEIGWLINPTLVDKTKAVVKYVDYLTEDQLKVNYNEIKDQNFQKIDYICMADNLDKIWDNSQDFVIWNHLFEHLSNPIKTLIEWNRVLKNGGLIYMAIPDKRRTFDVDRERTTLDHIVLDFTSPSLDRDREHYVECVSLVTQDSRQVEIDVQGLIDTNYSIHYHVFIEQDVQDIIDWCNKNTDSKFETVFVKHTAENPWDNEFIFILKVIK
jgi:ubiquinone/menaquinone biosynthesis C-methylase UbiE